jgi:nitroreductase
MLRYAILAPSNHNTQPWLFRINAMNAEVYADRRRKLVVVDPDGRELVVSCGAALYNLRIAAEYFGHAYRVELLPEPAQPDLMARLDLGLEGETSSEDVLLFHAITQRRTNRKPFEARPVPENLLADWVAATQEFGAVFHVISEEQARQAVADLVAEGDRRQWADRHFRVELSHWIRTRPDESPDGLPGAAAGVKDWLSFAGPMLIRTFDRGGGLAATDRDIAVHSPVLAVIATEQDDALAWLNAGQALQRVLLEATSEGIASSFLNQPIEIQDLRSRLAELAGLNGYPQVLLRLGYGPEVDPAPRRLLRQMLILHHAARP